MLIKFRPRANGQKWGAHAYPSPPRGDAPDAVRLGASVTIAFPVQFPPRNPCRIQPTRRLVD